MFANRVLFLISSPNDGQSFLDIKGYPTSTPVCIDMHAQKSSGSRLLAKQKSSGKKKKKEIMRQLAGFI